MMRPGRAGERKRASATDTDSRMAPAPVAPPRRFTIHSRSHFVLSVAVGVGAALVAGAPPGRGAGIVAYAAAVGVLIDLDHFLLARLRTGDWRALRYWLGRPSAAILDQGSIFEAGEVGTLRRLLSHVLLGGVLVLAVAALRPGLALLTAVVLYVHVVADLIADVRRLDRPASARS